jgi:hypothetical protein
MCEARPMDHDDISPIRAIHSLSQTQANAIIDGLRGLAGIWSIEHHQSCDGHLSLLLNDTTDTETVLIVDRDAAGIQISRMQGDLFHPGERRHNSVDDVIAALMTITGSDETGSRRRTA